MQEIETVKCSPKNQKDYMASELFENCEESFSAYELYTHADGKEDLKILAASRSFAGLIGADYDTLPGRLFTDACPMALDWLPFYIQVAKTGKENLHESYNQDLKKYLSALVFSPKLGEVAIIVVDRTRLWESDQALRAKNKELAAIFSSMTTGFCIGRVIRDKDGRASDLLFDMVNASFEILEGYPTAALSGRRLLDVCPDTPYLETYADVADHKKKVTFTKYIEMKDIFLEVTCFSQSDDTIIFIESDVTEKVRAAEKLKKAYETISGQNSMILASIRYASKIQRNLLPEEHVFRSSFADYSILWEPRDVVGGDIYWLKRFKQGSLLCVCDCTGHGTPGALLTMLVVSIFEDAVGEDNCADPSQILYLLDQRLANVLNVGTEREDGGKRNLLDFHDGCDLAALFIADDGSVSVSSANLPIFLCDGRKVLKLKGQRLSIGSGVLTSGTEVRKTVIPPNSDHKFYISSDGLFDQIGGKFGRPFGYQVFQNIVLEHHTQSQKVISDLVWEAFETYRGRQNRRDDIQLISFRV